VSSFCVPVSRFATAFLFLYDELLFDNGSASGGPDSRRKISKESYHESEVCCGGRHFGFDGSSIRATIARRPEAASCTESSGYPGAAAFEIDSSAGLNFPVGAAGCFIDSASCCTVCGSAGRPRKSRRSAPPDGSYGLGQIGG
jgi:hypothetical protein